MTAELMGRILWGLTVAYVLIALGCALLKDWPRTAYFFGAAVINVAVTMMGNR